MSRTQDLPPVSLRSQMDAIYRDLSLHEIPWNLEDPPAALVDFVERELAPCSAVDLGCGAGNYSVWLASRGFAVTGIDVSPCAIRLAQRLAEAKQMSCRFLAADLLGELALLRGSFEFAFDWEVLHHVPPRQRERYFRNVHDLLRPGGRYLSVCFAEGDTSFGGRGKVRETPLGTTLYFSAPAELSELLQPWFEVEEIGTEQVLAKVGSHLAVKAILRKRD